MISSEDAEKNQAMIDIQMKNGNQTMKTEKKKALKIELYEVTD